MVVDNEEEIESWWCFIEVGGIYLFRISLFHSSLSFFVSLCLLTDMIKGSLSSLVRVKGVKS